MAFLKDEVGLNIISIFRVIVFLFFLIGIGIDGIFAEADKLSGPWMGNKSSGPDKVIAECEGKVVFSKMVSDVQDVYIITGAGEQRLTDSSGADNFDPNLSTDCTKIVFSSLRDDPVDKLNTEIYVMNVDGSTQTRITNSPNLDEWPTWSPDGTKIVFSSTRDEELGEIYTMDADGNNVTRLTNNEEDDYQPDWSSNGKIAYIRHVLGENTEIFTMNADGSNNVRLTNNPSYEWNPSWSPDGTLIAFESNSAAPATGNFEIYTMNDAGGNVVRLTVTATDVYDGYPTWSSDGSKIIFSSNRNGNFDIFHMDFNGANLNQITNDINDEWSPDW